MNAAILNWLIPVLAIIATLAGTYFVSRRGSDNDFLDRVLKENAHYATEERRWGQERVELTAKVTDLHIREATAKDEIFQLRTENIAMRRKIDDLDEELGH